MKTSSPIAKNFVRGKVLDKYFLSTTVELTISSSSMFNPWERRK
jgi:hypothetical protein